MQKILILLLFFPAFVSAENYNDCILENMKEVYDRLAALQIQKACASKALPHIPAKCKKIRDESNPFNQFGGNEPDIPEYQECIFTCRNESYFSRFWGNCAP